MSRFYADKGLWLALLFACLMALWLQWESIVDPYQAEEDFRNAYWMHRFQDRAVFDDEILFQLYPRLLIVEAGPLYLPMDSGSPGYSWLFQIASYVIDPVTFSKLLVFPLLVWAVFYVYRIGELLRGPGTALVLALAFVIVNLSGSPMSTILGGLQRSFIAVFILGELYYLMTKRDVAAAILILISGFIYPPALFLCTAMYVLSLVSWQKKGRLPVTVDWQRCLPLLIVGVIATVTLLPILSHNVSEGSTDLSGSDESLSVFVDPVYQEGGRRQFFELFPLVGRGGIATQGTDFLYIFLFFALAIVIWLWQRDVMTRLHPGLNYLFFGSLLCYAAAWLAFIVTKSLVLYIPSRYTNTSFVLFGLIFVVIHVEESLQRFAAALLRRRHQIIWFVLPSVCIGVALVLFLPAGGLGGDRGSTRWIVLGLLGILLALTWVIHQRQTPPVKPNPVAPGISQTGWIILGMPVLLFGVGYVNLTAITFYEATPTEQALFAFLETLPQDAIIAGSPCELDSVLLFAKRTILFSCEQPNLAPDVTRDGLWAYYASDWETVTAFCQKHRVDYLVVNEREFSPEAIASGSYYFEPYDSELRPVVQPQTQFALANIPPAQKLFAYDELYVVACS